MATFQHVFRWGLMRLKNLDNSGNLWRIYNRPRKICNRNVFFRLLETFYKRWLPYYWDLVLCFDLLTRPKMPFKVMHRKEVTHSNGSNGRKWRGRKLADEMGRAKKIPMVHYRVMHRKRVTSELPDSYFRLMTIKHSISKIEWASNDHITQLSSTSQLNWVPVPVEFDAQGASGVASRVPDSWRRNVVGKATSGRRGLWALMSRGPEKMLIRCNKESQHPAEWALGLRLSSPREQERHNVTVITVGSKYYSSCSVSSSLSQ